MATTETETMVDNPIWAVRWSEVGFAPKLTRFDENGDQAMAFHRFLLDAYETKGRKTKPELLKSEIRWEKVA
jgi:hypothetical protein